MTRLRLLVASLVTVVAVSSCAAFTEAMTAHADTVARAGSQELTVDELAQLLANSDVPLRPDAARTLAQLWVNFQLLGQAGAHGDSLSTPEDADRGMWSSFAQIQTRKYYDHVAQGWGAVDSAGLEQKYNEGKELLAASHILLAKQNEQLGGSAVNDSIRREADRIAQTVTPATFAAVARQRSDDPGSKERGGSYGVFEAGYMVPEFDAGIRSVPPGGITGVVETQYGYHIIRRHTWEEAREQFTEMYPAVVQQAAEGAWFDALETRHNVQVKPSAPKLVKAIAEDVDAYRDDKTVVATARSGNLTAQRLAEWLAAFPPQSRMRANVMQAADSMIPVFVKNVMRNELLLREADSAKVGADSAERAEIRQAFLNGVRSTMERLNLHPSQLTDSAADLSAREELAGRRVDAYLSSLFRNEAQYVEVPEQLVIVLRDKYEARLVPNAIDRAVTEATRLRATADSTAEATRPPTSVPMPPANPQP